MVDPEVLAGFAAGNPDAVRVVYGEYGRLVYAVAYKTAAAAAAAIAVAVSLGGGTHPLQYQAALAGTALAPDASAQVTLTQTTSGWQIVLHGRGLPRLDNGYYYEAWLKNPAGILVPIGTFNQPQDVTLWAGVPPTQYPAITITRQRANGNPKSSGQRVLVGVAHPAHLTQSTPSRLAVSGARDA